MRTLLLLMLGAVPAFAQAGASPFLPNIYARPQQPLSPYLNLLRGGSPAVNYFYGVRPGLQNQNYGTYGNFYGGAYGQPPVYPTQGLSVYDPTQFGATVVDPGTREVKLRPAGHPVVYGNILNGHGSYPSVYAQNIGRGLGAGAAAAGGQGQGSGQRPQTAQPQAGLGAQTPRTR